MEQKEKCNSTCKTNNTTWGNKPEDICESRKTKKDIEAEKNNTDIRGYF